MPPSGIKLPANEIATIKKWINEGAKFDGKDPEENLNTFWHLGVKADTGPKVELAIATGKEKISYATDIAPMLLESCYDCHGGGRRAQGNFNMTTFDGFLRGGNCGHRRYSWQASRQHHREEAQRNRQYEANVRRKGTNGKS